MKRQFISFISILMLSVYTVFSTGLAFSIHRCCCHCFSNEKIASCGCDDSDLQKNINLDCSESDEHHRNHDQHLFFKITDKYKKADEIWITASHVVTESILLFCCENCKSFIINQIIKIRKNSPPLLLQKGKNFLESIHQLKLCC